ncbi:MAG: preprotein translocase subunit SecG [Chitinophagaceae bacterium]|nr:preprotein translocase subunit SecG [Chitinophagaceae bacterium]
MPILFLILIVLFCALLGLVVLIQNPKGGGLAGNIAGFSNQFMGVKQTTDVLEKGTWAFSLVIALLCLFSSLFMKSGNDDKFIKDINTGQQQQTTLPVAPQPGAEQPASTTPDPAQP